MESSRHENDTVEHADREDQMMIKRINSQKAQLHEHLKIYIDQTGNIPCDVCFYVIDGTIENGGPQYDLYSLILPSMVKDRKCHNSKFEKTTYKSVSKMDRDNQLTKFIAKGIA